MAYRQVKADRELGLGGKILLNASCKPQAKHLGKFFPECSLLPVGGHGSETGLLLYRRYMPGFRFGPVPSGLLIRYPFGHYMSIANGFKFLLV
jgi:hypothetical protein